MEKINTPWINLFLGTNCQPQNVLKNSQPQPVPKNSDLKFLFNGMVPIQEQKSQTKFKINKKNKI